MFFQKIALPSWDRFFFAVRANIPPFSLQKSTKIFPKIDPKMHQFFDRFLHRCFIDFWSILEANLEPCWPLFRTKYGEGIWGKGAPCWVYVIFRFFGRPGPLLGPFWLDFGGFGAPFWRFLGSILEVFGLHFGRFWLGMGWWGYAKRKEFWKLFPKFKDFYIRCLLFQVARKHTPVEEAVTITISW